MCLSNFERSLSLCARDARRDCSGPFPPRATSRRRQCLVARDIAALAHQGRGTRRWHLERICRHTAEIFDGRFISATQDAVVVSGRIPDADASRLLPIIDSLDNSLAEVRARHSGYSISVTGLSVIAARNSATMIEKLSRGLTLEFGFVAVFIGAAFRSLAVMFSAILPGIFPIVASGAILSATGQGLQFASIVALTVSFGLGLSATIHFSIVCVLRIIQTRIPALRLNARRFSLVLP